MNKDVRIKKALDELEYDVEIIEEINVAPTFVEVAGTIGGDSVRYRVYFDDNDNITHTCAK